MVEAVSKRLDHHGIVAGVIKDLDLIEAIDGALGTSYDQNDLTPGEAVAGLIINGLGFSDRPLSLIPEFFDELPMETLLRKGAVPEKFNRHKLGRVLDKIFDYGCSKLFCETSMRLVGKEGIEIDTLSLDTTSFSVSGNKYEDPNENEYEDSDERVVNITHGYSKDHKPGWRQLVQELIVTHDSGIPLYMKNHDGNASDNKVFTDRSKEIRKNFNFNLDHDFTLIADSKLYTEGNSENLRQLQFITRVPEVNRKVKQVLDETANQLDPENKELSDSFFQSNPNWTYGEKNCYYQEHNISHIGIDQKWLVVCSKESLNRAQKTVEKSLIKEQQSIKKFASQLKSKSFITEPEAIEFINKNSKKWRFHSIKDFEVTKEHTYSRAGRPSSGETPTLIKFKISFISSCNDDAQKKAALKKACFVLATNKLDLAAVDIIEKYKSQQSVERGFRFLKDPLFFTSSFFLKSTKRIEALVTVMTMALLVYSIAQRRLRKALEINDETIPNQINKPVKNPTLRRVFQLFHGINIIEVTVGSFVHTIVQGVEALHLRILEHISPIALKFYVPLR